MERWRHYWSAPGGRLAVAALRIAIAASLIWTLVRIAGHATAARSALYYPHGIWLAFPGRPGPAVLAALTCIAWPSTIAFGLGLGTRVSHAISLVSVLALATFEVSSMPTWTHQNVPPLLASIALLGSRCSDAWSIDAALRRRRGLAPLDVPGAYGWTVRLVQLAVASVFFVAACSKLAAGGPHLAWALSDNLRHQLLMRFDWIHLPRTAIADWIVAEPWRYRSFAVLNLCSQISPLGAVFAMRRPWLRAALGAVWCCECLALGVVMALWDTHWLPLAAAFVDWDRLLAALAPPTAPPPPAPSSPAPRAPRRRLVLVSVLIGFAAVQAFVFNQRLNLYPFSSYPMFSQVRAKRPYDRHQSYELIGGRIELVATDDLDPHAQRWIDRRVVYRWMWQQRDPGALHRQLQGVLDDARRRFPSAGITAVRLWLIVDRAPAYPAPARLDRFDLAITGELDTSGQFRSALGRLDGDRVVTPIDLDRATLLAYRDDVPEPIRFAALRDPTGFTLAAPLPGDPLYLVAILDGVPWLVAQRSRRGY